MKRPKSPSGDASAESMKRAPTQVIEVSPRRSAVRGKKPTNRSVRLW